MPPEQNEHEQMRDLMLENQRLLTDNHKLLEKMNKRSVLSFWLRIVGFMILLGVPFALYYYVIQPYFTNLDEALIEFKSDLQRVPGWEEFRDAIGGKR